MNYNFNSQNKLSASSLKEYFMNSSGDMENWCLPTYKPVSSPRGRR